MTPREELAAWLRSVYIANRPLFGDTGANPVGWERVVDEVVAMGWTPPKEGRAMTSRLVDARGVELIVSERIKADRARIIKALEELKLHEDAWDDQSRWAYDAYEQAIGVVEGAPTSR